MDPIKEFILVEAPELVPYVQEQLKLFAPKYGRSTDNVEFDLREDRYEPGLEIRERLTREHHGIERPFYRYQWGHQIESRHGFASPEHGEADGHHYHCPRHPHPRPLSELGFAAPQVREELVRDFFEWLDRERNA